MSKTLRMIIPQWQGGDYSDINPSQIYPLGSHLLNFLAPKSDALIVEIPIDPPTNGSTPKQNGVLWQETVLKQFLRIQKTIHEHQPERIIVFGGDCLVNQAPFAYLNERYDNVGLLWIDTHPDITTPADFDHAHAMVLGNLLGDGDPVLSKEVKKPFKSNNVLIVGVNEVLPHEQNTINRLNLHTVPVQKIKQNSHIILEWLEKNKIKNLAIHVDLDVLDPRFFYSQLLRNPDAEPFPTANGQMTIQQLTRIIKDVSANRHVVGIGFTEHMPWDALRLKNMMEEFDFMK